MKFQTKFRKRERFSSNPGSGVHATYRILVDDDGHEELQITGKVDTQEKIEAWRESTDLKTLIKRYNMGETDALQSTQAIYGDFSEMPKDLAGYLQLMRDAENAFMHLTPDIRERFHNSPSEFYTAFGTDEFYSALGVINNAGTVDEPKGENVTDEPKSE